MVVTMLADGDVGPGEIETIRKTHYELTGLPFSEEEVREEVSALLGDGESPYHHLDALREHLSHEGRIQLVRAAYLVAHADGTFGEGERETVQCVATALGMDEAELHPLLAQFDQDASA